MLGPIMRQARNLPLLWFMLDTAVASAGSLGRDYFRILEKYETRLSPDV